LLTGYLLGAIPFCFLIGKLYGVDIRTLGSGNVGATNLRRGLTGKPLGRLMAGLGLFLDGLKGYTSAFWLPPLAVHFLAPTQPYPISAEWLPVTAGVAAVLGHTFTVFLKFRGGKGVATGIGMFLAICLPAALVGIAVFVVIFAITRISSLGSLVGAASVPVASCVYYHYTSTIAEHAPVVGMLVGVVVLVFIRHRANIGRLMRGEELSFRAQEKAAEAAAAAAGTSTQASVATEPVEKVERSAH
ncbi:MAG TPA: glycerol-3-phosphate 1-O-acyltransferase PlsY, partial [Planctomycetota bacterium]|nr:glycerol-3-phosphate 1-O-acyltransferase PlsY [Planctomycetota bacterium]